MATLEIEGKRVEVDDSFKAMSPEQQAATVEEIAQSLGVQAGGPSGTERFLGQAARSIGEAVDGLTLGARNDIGKLFGQEPKNYGDPGTAQAVLQDAGIASSDAPQGILENAGGAAGDAMVAFAPVVKAFQTARGLGGTVGAIADDAYTALASKIGLGTEVAAGAASGAGSEAAKKAGYGPGVQSLAGLAAPLSVPAVGSSVHATARAADAVTDVLPGARYGKEVARGIKQAIVPMTDAGATEVARTRIQQLAGGEERAAELGARINPSDEFGRTGAQQTADPNLLGLQKAVADENPVIREVLDARSDGASQSIVDAVRSMGGDVRDARVFFRTRLRDFKKALGERANSVMQKADQVLENIGPSRTESDVSTAVVEKLKAELGRVKSEESALWDAVPRDIRVPTASLKAKARNLSESVSIFQQADIPEALRLVLGNQVGDELPLSEAHGLYSELRRISRVARSGDNQSRNMARIADGLADDVLKAFDALPGTEIAEARAFTKALNETFYTGAPGKLLARTKQTNERIPAEVSLKSTVGRGGVVGAVDEKAIRNAAPDTQEDMGQFLRNGFSNAAINASGEFTPKAARTWMRNNKEALREYPEMASELRRALKDRDSADAFSTRATERAKLSSSGVLEKFNSGRPETAIKAILGADDPIKAARSVAATARKDSTGKALAGVKGAVSGYLTVDPKRLVTFLDDARTKAAFRQVFSADEITRLSRISKAAESLSAPSRDVGEVINSPANQLVEVAVRMAGARAGAAMHSGKSAGESLQAAQLGASRANRWLANLTNDKARQILVDAVQDPALMRALLIDANAPKLPKWARSKLAPYISGSIAAQE